MRHFLLNILLALAWMLLTGDLDFMNFLEGFILGYIILWIASISTGERKYFKRLPKLIAFTIYFVTELVKANLKLAVDIVTPRHRMKPAIVAINISAETDLEITLLSNLITLTPGTLSLDVSKDRKVLYVHGLYIEDVDEFKDEIKNGLEKKLLEVMR